MEKRILLQRLVDFKARRSECLFSRFYSAPGKNFLAAEQIHLHYAKGQCKTEYVDIIEFWMHSLFNFLEDRFEDEELEERAVRSQWKPMDQALVFATIRDLFAKIGSSGEVDIDTQPQKTFQMFGDDEIVAFVMETPTAYISFSGEPPLISRDADENFRFGLAEG